MAKTIKSDLYDHPECYDLLFAGDTVPEADFLEALQEKHAFARGKDLLEPACGSGRLVEEMLKRGYRVCGFDANEKMLAFARKRASKYGRRARLFFGNLEGFRLDKKFDMAYCLVSTFRYLLTGKAAVSHLRCISRSLKKGGIYVLGFHLCDYQRSSFGRERMAGKSRGRAAEARVCAAASAVSTTV